MTVKKKVKKVVKKPKDELFVQVGMRRNGRIVKAENYKIKQFCELLVGEQVKVPVKPNEVELMKLTLFDYMFNKKKREEAAFNRKKYYQYVKDLGLYCSMKNNYFLRNQEVMYNFKKIYNIILKDNFGKKK